MEIFFSSFAGKHTSTSSLALDSLVFFFFFYLIHLLACSLFIGSQLLIFSVVISKTALN